MNKKHFILFISSLALSTLFIISFSPKDIPLIITLLPTIGFTAATYFLLKIGLRPLSRGSSTKKPLAAVPLAGGLTLGLCIILSSLGQLNFGSWLLVLSLMILSVFFITKMKQ